MAAVSLKAMDEGDLAVIAACLQDALIPVADLAYLAAEQRFVFVANRYLWEVPGDRLRCNAAVAIEGVSAVRYRGLDRGDPDAILSLLTLAAVPGGLELTFAGAAAIRLDTDRIGLQLQDMGEPWPAMAVPSHGDGETPPAQ